jgi:peptide/nickel transport system substrate-binding protein
VSRRAAAKLARGALSAALALALAAPAAAGVRPAYGGTVRLVLPALPREDDPALAVDPADLVLVRATAGLLLEVGRDGRLEPGLLAEVPAADAEGRVFRLRVDPLARTAAGAPVLATDVARALARLLSPTSASPHAWAASAVLGADEVLAGNTELPAGLQVLSEHELLVTLSLPLPELPWILATTACAVPGAGPFAAPPSRPGRAVALALAANPHHPRGRPLADRLVLSAADARGAARLLERGEADGVLRPDAAGDAALPLPALTATVAGVNGARLGGASAAVRGALAALDRTALARRFVRGPAVPLATLVPPAALGGDPGAEPGPAQPPPPPPSRAPTAAAAPRRARPLRLLVADGAPEARAAAERLQVLLFDAGLRAAVDSVPRAAFAARTAAGDYDVAVVSVAILAPRPAPAAAQLAHALRGAGGARRALGALAGKEGADAAAAAAALARELDLFPLVASGARATAAPRLRGLVPSGGGDVDPALLWLVGGGGP